MRTPSCHTAGREISQPVWKPPATSSVLATQNVRPAAAAGAAKKDLFVTTRSHSVKSDVSDFLGLIAKEAQNRWAMGWSITGRAGAKDEGLFIIEIQA